MPSAVERSVPLSLVRRCVAGLVALLVEKDFDFFVLSSELEKEKKSRKLEELEEVIFVSLCSWRYPIERKTLQPLRSPVPSLSEPPSLDAMYFVSLHLSQHESVKVINEQVLNTMVCLLRRIEGCSISRQVTNGRTLCILEVSETFVI